MNFRKALTMRIGDRVIHKQTKEILVIEELERVELSDYCGVYFHCSDGETYYHTTVMPADREEGKSV